MLHFSKYKTIEKSKVFRLFSILKKVFNSACYSRRVESMRMKGRQGRQKTVFTFLCVCERERERYGIILFIARHFSESKFNIFITPFKHFLFVQNETSLAWCIIIYFQNPITWLLQDSLTASMKTECYLVKENKTREREREREDKNLKRYWSKVKRKITSYF